MTGSKLLRTDLAGVTLANAIVSERLLRQTELKCTRMPDGTIFDEEDCTTFYSPLTPVP